MDNMNFPQDMDSNDQDDLIELVDEEGETTLFEHMATLEHQGETFLALTPAGADEDDDADMEILIMQIQQDENGQDIYVRPDEALEEQVFEKFLKMIDEMEEED